MQPETPNNKCVVYVAGAFRDERIARYIQHVQQLEGFTVTHDWTLERERPASDAAAFDIEGVRQCDYLVAVMNYNDARYDYRGTFTELGAALALKKNVIVVRAYGDGADEVYAYNHCFFWHPDIVYVTSFDAALRLLSATRVYTPRLLIVGHARHGKDTLAEAAQRFDRELTFASSSEAANRLVVYPVLRERYGYESERACFDDRYNHRMEWYALICEYNREDKARLAKEIMRDNRIYVGMRDAQEFEASRALFDLTVWVDATERMPEADPSLFITRDQADVVVPNNTTLREYETRITAFLRLLILPPLVHV